DRGNVSLVESKDRPLLGTAVGATTGLLIGLLGGAPLAAVGATLGDTIGIRAGVLMAALDAGFIDEVKRGLHPGMTAVIVAANEGSTSTVDELVALRGGHVYRQEAAQI